MILSDLTICMPSHRDFTESRPAIESLLAFSELTGCHAVISDNSGDPRKRSVYAGRSPRLTYLVPEGEDAVVNLVTALSPVVTRFVMPMGDDDHIRLEGRPRDLSTLPDDVVAVRPSTEIWSMDGGVCRVETFTIDAAGADERILEYNQKALGNNSLYYSIFRSDAFLSTLRLFAEAHPTVGGYCDWALCFALFACGRVVHDPAIIYRYDHGRWSTEEQIRQQKAALFEKARLPAAAEDLSALLRFLDLYILVLNTGLPLTPADRDKALLMNSRIALASFLRAVKSAPARYDETVRYLVDLIIEETELNTVYVLALMLADCLQPGLKQRYIAYYQVAVAPQNAAA